MEARKINVKLLEGGVPLMRNAFFCMRLLQSHQVIVLARTSQPFQAAADVDRCTAELARTFPRGSRAGVRIVLDMRESPIRVHPALDPAFERLRKETQAGFSRIAVVVTTPLGRARADRLASVDGAPMQIVASMQEAAEFINGDFATTDVPGRAPRR